MHENVRHAGIAVLIGLTIAWMIGFLVMVIKPNVDRIGWLGLVGASLLIVIIFAMLRVPPKRQ